MPPGDRSSGLRPSDLASLLALVLLTAIFFFPLLTGHTFTTVAGHQTSVYPWASLHQSYRDVPQSDQADLTYPWRRFARDAFRHGVVPFWNPLSFGGQPFFANGSSALLYLPHLLAALVLPIDRAHDLVSVLHVLLAGIFMYLLLRAWDCDYPGALFGAVAWMFAPFNMAWLHLEVVAPVAVWLPLSLLLIARAFHRESWPATVGAALALAGALVSGHLLFCGLVYAVAVMYAGGVAAHIVVCGRPGAASGWTSALLRLLIVAAGPFALGAVVLIPTALYLGSLGRSSLTYEVAHAGVRVPYEVFGYLLHPPAPPLSELAMHQMAYVGTVTALLAVIGFFMRSRGGWLGRLLTVGVFLVATDTILLRWVYAFVPGFSFFSPLGRLLNLFAFGVVVLAAPAFDAVASGSRRAPRLVVTAILVGFTALDLLWYGWAVNPTFVPRDPNLEYPATPMIAALMSAGVANGTAPGRVLPLRQSQRGGWTQPVLYAAESMVFGIDSANGYDSTLPSRAEDVWRFVAGQGLDEIESLGYRRAFVTSYEVDRVRFYMLSRVGITALAAPPHLSVDPIWVDGRTTPLALRQTYEGSDGQVFTLGEATGGPWFVRRAEIVDDRHAALARFADRGFDERQSVVLERGDLAVAGASAADTAAPLQTAARVSLAQDGINSLRVHVRSDTDGWVVIPNVWDAGWRGRAGDRDVPVLRANYAFQAVPVTRGDTDLSLTYRPRGIELGTATSLVSLLLAAVLAATQRRRRQSGPVLSPTASRLG